MWRDRTNLFISYRQSYTHHPIQRYKSSRPSATGSIGFSSAYSNNSNAPEDQRGLLSGNGFDEDGDAVIEMDLLPPRWADVSDEITELLADVATKGQSLEKLHRKHVLPGFNDDEAKKAEELQIERLTQQITKSFHECHRRIQRVEQLVRESKQSGAITKAEETMAKNIQISLATRVQDASASFRKKQSAYLKRLRDMGGLGTSTPTERSSTPQSGAFVDPSLQESDADRSFSQLTLQAASQQKLLHSNDAAIAQREREIEDIAQGIIELSDLFRDLQNMVIDQGTMLDRIDYNVERMNEDVKGADKEIRVASGYQRRSTKRKIILLLIIIIIGLFILLLVKPKK
ncbi:t-SNARE affecting a late Golgi compartment protein 2 [Conoideocrella luteorostrata]|uniref:t-SNARE affecting a late Golgi compartment protein 2 n=1 Tax=Conoideocrella luteorostrata TaxID=1105319 RepID=A0AAJ0CXY7_9HYPO|nr:t-SNARE affecting a late Golgi compartment protein 2 [Conoideocrella luteorostrata]